MPTWDAHMTRSRIKTCHRIALFLLFLNADTTFGGNVLKQESSGFQKPSLPCESSLIVCAVDGSVYTLNAKTGDLLGHFSSGTPLVAASGAEDWDERIVPGLDGRLYTLKEGPQLKALPITVMDILANPMRTCREGERDCGIVTATKSASLYAFDPATGVLQWKSSFEEERKQDKEERNKESVVLQREDFVVRHISASTGGELWNVSVGHYLALNFDEEPTHPKLQSDLAQKQMPGRREQFLLDENGGDFPEKPKMPAVAFSEDGLSVVAIEEKSGTILWQRKLESVVASVYAISENGWVPLRVLDDQEFVRFGGNDMWNTGVTAALPSSSSLKEDLGLTDSKQPRERHKYFKKLLKQEIPSYMVPPMPPSDNGALVLYEPPNVKGLLQWKARLSRQDSTLFVQSSSSPHDSCLGSPDGFCQQPIYPGNGEQYMGNSAAYPYGRGDTGMMQKLLPSPTEPPTIELPDIPVQHTNGGLFLTWPMVIALVVFLVGTAAMMRIHYVRQKRKWALLFTTPPLLPTNPNSKEEDDEGLPKPLFSLDGVRSEMTLPYHSNHTTNYLEKFSSSPSTPVQSKKTLSRSMSLPTFFNGVTRDFAKPKERTTSDHTTEHVATAVTPGTTATAAVTSAQATAPSPASSISPFAGVGNIDGIPLVRYSRYRSEFNELSALGKGGFGTVFRCENALDGREYAVKKILIKSNTDAFGNVTKEFSQRLQRVLREVKILALLDHPNIVRYYTAWLELEEDGAMDDVSSSEYATTADKNKMARCFSSELLTTCGPSDTQNWRISPGRSRLGQGSVAARYAKTKANKNEVLSNNPLGWNNFMTDGNSFDSFRRRRSINEEEDIGITFERSNSGLALDKIVETRSGTVGMPVVHDDASDSESSSSSSSSSDSDSSDSWNSSEEPSESNTRRVQTETATTIDKATGGRTVADQVKNKTSEHGAGTGQASVEHSSQRSQVRHILYIQMQLCSQKSLTDFLSNPEARKGDTKSSDDSAVDIPYALGLFSQIAQGVKHVHQQGLIHRDLKPSNCFIDDSGVVKVGDFGLSRESSTGIGQDDNEGDTMTDSFRTLGGDDITAGVGTRSYASPEQMNGSDYDASTDVYSLGIMLFELCYPMYTGMERHIVFEGLRKRSCPDWWNKKVAVAFPTLHSLLMAMLSPRPSDRPSADDVAQRIESLLGEYTVLSLDRNRHRMDNSVLLRVEASAEDGVLPRTLKLIKDAAPGVNIVQYGLRGQESKAIMEFALSAADDNDESSDNEAESALHLIMKEMERSDDIILARQVSHGRH